MTNSQTAVSILAEKTMRAAVHIALTEGLNKSEDFADRLSAALKETVKSALDRVMAEWKEALDANINDLWLQKLIDTQAIELAQAAIESIK